MKLHRLNMYIDPDDESKTHWVFGDDWNPGKQRLQAAKNDELAFYLGSKYEINITKLTIKHKPLDDSPAAPYSEAFGAFRDGGYPGKAPCPPKGNADHYQKWINSGLDAYVYWWGTVVNLNNDGDWEMSATVDFDYKGKSHSFSCDPKMCVGTGCR